MTHGCETEGYETNETHGHETWYEHVLHDNCEPQDRELEGTRPPGPILGPRSPGNGSGPKNNACCTAHTKCNFVHSSTRRAFGSLGRRTRCPAVRTRAIDARRDAELSSERAPSPVSSGRPGVRTRTPGCFKSARISELSAHGPPVGLESGLALFRRCSGQPRPVQIWCIFF